ncbi:heavy metal-binding domain-containing protein [Yeosuana sp. MJ-SS3]|uniref:Heavy metal-binding domain-containing protein n=1 Tax=Gilvirhabdus luticola TaxID=3079858 RepID=A0ABU3U2S1_9FLAO|nr:heavy metal-binding domain-containing protein [Yeosuana sp. MJ-SS3]MDU8884693.1 heavy metal-binding domain-containing protein [Yeosuana sp. MJ-SS3]
MVLTTTDTIEGFKIQDYLGIVSGVGVNARKATFTFNVEKYFNSLEESVLQIKEEAFQKIKENAKKLNANAIVGISVDVETFPSSMYIMVSVTGTAVRVG